MRISSDGQEYRLKLSRVGSKTRYYLLPTDILEIILISFDAVMLKFNINFGHCFSSCGSCPCSLLFMRLSKSDDTLVSFLSAAWVQ